MAGVLVSPLDFSGRRTARAYCASEYPASFVFVFPVASHFYTVRVSNLRRANPLRFKYLPAGQREFSALAFWSE